MAKHNDSAKNVTAFTTKQDVQKGLSKLLRRIEDINGLDAEVSFDDPKIAVLLSSIKSTIRDVFGAESSEFRENQYHQISRGRMHVGMSRQQLQRNFQNGIPHTIAMLNGLMERLREKASELPDAPNGPAVSLEDTEELRSPANRDVFLVHGHNNEAKEKVARFLERLALNVVILHEQPNDGRTIIEKFSDFSDVDFAIILLTADDFGGPKAAKPGQQNLRARQNVVFEFGFFIGKLGRNKVCALREEGVEIPSDISGIIYLDLDRADAWRLQLARELRSAGIGIDLNRIA